FEQIQRSTSDAKHPTRKIKIGGDGYFGYWFLTSPEMRIQSPREGFTVDFTDDGGMYAERLEKFNKKEYDIIVLPINSYLQHGAKYKFPGVIVAGICESKGADAIVGFADVLPTDNINELDNAGLKIVYTGGSPSSFLLDLMISDFGLENLRNSKDWRREVGGSVDVFKQAKKAVKDRKQGDAFVLWEPQVSQAIENLGLKYLWGSDKFAGYIIDVMVVHRKFVEKHPDLTLKFLKTYFRTMDTYAGEKEKMVKEMSKSMSLKKSVVKNIIGRIDWFDLHENCNQLFGIQTNVSLPAYDKLISSIIQCGTVMERAGIFNTRKLADPYLIVYSEFLSKLIKSDIRKLGVNRGAEGRFAELNENQWSQLKEVGTMRIEPISFQQGTNYLDETGKDVVDNVATLLINNYPGYRIAVRGHTGPGDLDANKQLSVERAEMVAQRLIAVHGMQSARLKSEGMGATVPPKRKPGESMRSLRFRMPRVEFVLLEMNKF
ncbi:MAG: OmpA family protein, partial [Fibrobacteria bacterium]|nr:OmpA family protein [Fibrobacteria bacterium]